MCPSFQKYKLIAFDLDGVLVKARSSWEFIHDYFGVSKNDRIKNYLDYVMGRIDYNEWIKRDVGLWNKALGRRLRIEDLIEAISDIPVDRDVELVAKELKRRGYIIGIISAGVGQVAGKIAEDYGFDFWIANTITFTEDGLVSENQRARMPPYRKPLTLLWTARQYGISIKEVVYVGDSDWDIGAVRLAGCGVAYNCSPNLKRNANISITRLVELLNIIDNC